jgi:hypothetical protein
MRCRLRLSARGIYVDGNPTTRADAVTACKRSAGAVVALEEGLRVEDWHAIEKEFKRAGVAVHVLGRLEDSPCSVENPLARGCN